MTKLEIHRTESINEWSLGVSLAYGEDENGQFHMTDVGFGLFRVCVLRYL